MKPWEHTHELTALRALTTALAVCLAQAAASDALAQAPHERVEASADVTRSTLADQRRYQEIRRTIDISELEQAEVEARAYLAEVESRYGRESLQAAEVIDLLVDALWPAYAKVIQPETQELAQRAVSLKESILGREDPRVAISLVNLAIVLDESGMSQNARTHFERALAIAEKKLPPNHALIAKVLTELGFLLSRIGEYIDAQNTHARALRIIESAPGDELEKARVLNGLAEAEYELGMYPAARAHWDEALRIRIDHFGKKHPRVAGILNNLGALLMVTGDYELAEDYLTQALEIRNAKPNSRHTAVTCNNLGSLRNKQGQLEQAKILFDRARDILEEQRKDHPLLIRPLHNLAKLNQALERWDAASEYFARALTIAESKLGHWHALVGLLKFDQGVLEYERGNLEAARSLFTQSLAIRSTSLRPEHPDVTETLLHLAFVLSKSGQDAAALDAALRAEALGRQHLGYTIRGWSERDALLFSQVRVSGLALALQIVDDGRVRDAVMLRRVWDQVIRSRAFILDEISTRNWLASRSEDPEIQALLERLQEARRRLSNLVVRGPGDQDPKVYQKLFEFALEDVKSLEGELATAGAKLHAPQRREVGLADVAAHLPSQSGLVAYAIYRPLDDLKLLSTVQGPAWRSGTKVDGLESRVVAFVLQEGGDPTLVGLGALRSVDSLVSRWREEAAVGLRASGRTPSTALAAYRAWGDALRRHVWDSLQPHLADPERVFIVPDGSLHLVNFAALPTEDQLFLVEAGKPLHYLTAERDLAHTWKPDVSGEGLLAMGGADFDLPLGSAPTAKTASSAPPRLTAKGTRRYRGGRVSCDEFREVRFDSLPATAVEVRSVAELWTNASGDRRVAVRAGYTSNARPDALVLTGADATEAMFKKHAPGRLIVHLATHGFFVDGDCIETTPGRRGIKVVSARQKARNATEARAPLHAGLVFSGGNNRHLAQSHAEDAVTTAEEIISLNLHGTKWAVLSACDTGVGEVLEGEGVLGLRRSFQASGVQSLVMSLWRVDDDAARRWMEALYSAHLEKRLGTADAVHQATLDTLDEFRQQGKSHPFYWASFVAAGDWR